MNITDITGNVELSNGVRMPYFGLGVFNMHDGEEVRAAVRNALKIGYRLIDTAALYGNERGVGEAVAESGIARSGVFVTSKVWNSDQGYDSTLKAFERSLDRLGFEYLDLYLIHWPVKGKFRETWRALERLYDQKLVKAIGVSNFLRHHLDDLLHVCKVPPMVNQVEFHPHLVQQDLLDFCRDRKIQYESWSPLMRGMVFDVRELKPMAAKYKKDIAQLVLRWNLQKGVVVIPKSVRPERIESNARIFDFEISPEDMSAIDRLDRHKRYDADPDTFNF